AVWDVPTGKVKEVVALIDLTGLYALEFSADDMLLVCACNTGVALYDAATMQRRFYVRGDKAFVASFSPRNPFLAIPSFQLGVVRLWHAASNGEVVALRHPTAPHVAAFTADGNTLVVADTKSVRLWDLAGSGEKLVLAGHSRGVAGLAFSPDG